MVLFFRRPSVQSPVLIALVLCTAITSLLAQNSGSLSGTVVDAATHHELPGVHVQLVGTKLGAVSSTKGVFSIQAVPPGVYAVQVRSVGYSPLVVTDVVVQNARTAHINVELKEAAVKTEDVTVEAQYFTVNESTPLSSTVFSAEEIRRAPGSAGDVNRVLSSSPSVGRIDDSRADLSIRGGSPAENSFYVDNIPVLNINYFPKQGASGGPISFLNISQVKKLTFLSGAFDASHEALSGVVDVSLREPSSDNFGADLEFNMIGVGAAIEGPLGEQNSYYLSATRGYLDLLKGLLDQTGTPQWANVQTKLSFKLGGSDRLSILGISALSDMLRKKDEALNTNTSDNHNQQWQNIYGANWQHLLESDGYMNTSISVNTLHSFEIAKFPQNDSVFFDNETSVRIASLRNVTHLIHSKTFSSEFGVDLRSESQSLRSFVPAQFNTSGTLDSALHEYHEVSLLRSDVFGTLLTSLNNDLVLSTGLRLDHSSYSLNSSFETLLLPRLSLLWSASSDIQLSCAYGHYAQNLPLGLLQYSLSKSFPSKPVVSRHIVASIAWNVAADSRLSLESYYKRYANMPISVSKLYSCPLDQAVADFDFDQTRVFRFDGSARAYGAELSLQKKMSSSVYLMSGLSYSRSFYTDGMGIERSRAFDNQFLCTVSGGWRVADTWELSGQFCLAGGNAYTPLDSSASRLQGKEVWSGEYMGAHLPLYKILNLRVDKRFNMSSSNLVLYLTLLNALDLQNVKTIEFNPYSKAVVQTYHIGFLPILGVEWQL